MCEVGSCCGCICLYKGCLISGIVTILVAAVQVSIFSLMLFESYESSTRSSAINASSNGEAEPTYHFTGNSSLCPFGFHPLLVKANQTINNSTEEETITNIAVTNLTQTYTNSSTESIRTVSCLAPPQGVLVALVVTSVLYAPVGVILMIGVKKCVSCLLSMWFFYTVGYNLLALIIALTDGVYVGAGDVSSYCCCLVTAYCVIVVDSYYEKLLRHEKALTSAKSAERPSLVVVKSCPHSPSSMAEEVPLGKCPPPDENITEPSSFLLPSRIAKYQPTDSNPP